MEIVDLFAGPGGWDIAARDIGLDPLGVEIESNACATRDAAGLRTLRADVAELQPDAIAIDGLIASPPCQAFSRAGKMEGRLDREQIHAIAHGLAHGRDERADRRPAFVDARSILVIEPLRWALATRPRWIALEQVPDVAPFWTVVGDYLTDAGYHVWTGVLNAADYGVPQTRERAILLAHRDRPVGPPEATHADGRRGVPMFVDPWVTMSDALDWDEHDLVGFPRRNDVDDGGEYRERDRRPASMPAFNLTEKARSWTRVRPATTVLATPRIAAPGHRDRSSGGTPHFDDSVPVTLEEAATLQTFPTDYPWQGSRTACFLQVANAIPPRLARHLLDVVTA